jgi:GNAT superfamily N-acetyltransferase
MPIIQPIKESDFPELIELQKEFAIFQKTPEKFTNTLERMLGEKEFFNAFVAKEEETIVGFATYFYTYHSWSGKGMHLDDLYVKESHRSQNLGSQLMNKVIETARQTGCHSLRWLVSEWNKPAIAYYKKLGADVIRTEMNCELKISPS